MLPRQKITAATLAAALMAAPLSFAVAQEGVAPEGTEAMPEAAPEAAPETAPEAPAATPTPDFDDAQIDAFANAALKVGEIQQKYAQQLEGVEDEAEQQQLVQEADTEIRAAIEGVDNITIEDYLEIDQAATMDEDLTRRIAERMQQIQAEQAG
ncbi:DUF4168 domain-containing protein [Pontibaca methylaminivorans]|uniref:DUF4168 domain-containing protein n=1 Tax=Pontibaca methylaminivorans TaxID=515897 RepID=UPI002FDAD8BE